VTITGEHPEVAWKACGVPLAGMEVGDTEHPESETVVSGPELATVTCTISLTFAVSEKVPELTRLFWSPE